MLVIAVDMVFIYSVSVFSQLCWLLEDIFEIKELASDWWDRAVGYVTARATTELFEVEEESSPRTSSS